LVRGIMRTPFPAAIITAVFVMISMEE